MPTLYAYWQEGENKEWILDDKNLTYYKPLTSEYLFKLSVELNPALENDDLFVSYRKRAEDFRMGKLKYTEAPK